MDNIIEINNLSFGYDNHIVLSDFNLSIRRGSFNTILGNNGCGKSTLVRLLCGLEDSHNNILIDGICLTDNVSFVRSKIGVVFENPNNCLFSETVLENMAFPLKNLNYSSDYIYSRINYISNYLGISNLLNSCIDSLSGGEKQLVSLGCALVAGPKIIILDEAFSMISGEKKISLFNILKKIQIDFGVTILNITHDIEESVFSDDIIIIDSGQVVIHDSNVNVYKQEKLLKRYGFDLPFMVDLSNKLSYYDMVDDLVFNMNEMVDLLWE